MNLSNLEISHFGCQWYGSYLTERKNQMNLIVKKCWKIASVDVFIEAAKELHLKREIEHGKKQSEPDPNYECDWDE